MGVCVSNIRRSPLFPASLPLGQPKKFMSTSYVRMSKPSFIVRLRNILAPPESLVGWRASIVTFCLFKV